MTDLERRKPPGGAWETVEDEGGGGGSLPDPATVIRARLITLSSFGAGYLTDRRSFPFGVWFDADEEDYEVVQHTLVTVGSCSRINFPIDTLAQLTYAGTKPALPAALATLIDGWGGDVSSFPDVSSATVAIWAGSADDPVPHDGRVAVLSFAAGPVPLPTSGGLAFDSIDNSLDTRFTLADGVLSFEPGEGDNGTYQCVIVFIPGIDAFYP